MVEDVIEIGGELAFCGPQLFVPDALEHDILDRGSSSVNPAVSFAPACTLSHHHSIPLQDGTGPS